MGRAAGVIAKMAYDYQPFPYVRPTGLDRKEHRHKVVIVGAGPIGLAAAIELAQHGVASVVLDDNNVVSVGSRAICWSKRSLEILDRLGVGAACLAKGVTWKVGRTFHGGTEIYNFDLLPEAGHKMPAFVNLQQYYVEEYLVRRALEFPGVIELRWKNKVVGLVRQTDGVIVEIETPDGTYAIETEWLLACDGANSDIRRMMKLHFDGEMFEEKFLIADIEMTADFPSERWFWFEPSFHPGQSALLHKQPDNIYRIDLQLGWGADANVERQPERIIPRIEKVVGHSDFRLDWASVYSFRCGRLANFVHGRVVFVGDSAHVVSPFGARGGNGGLQDVDALCWRLAAIVQGRAEAEILGHYDAERCHGSDENIQNSSRTTRFMTPADGIEKTFRDAVLALAHDCAFARPLVNSGRLSLPCTYPLQNASDDVRLPACSVPGSVAPDAPIGAGWLLDQLGGEPTLLILGESSGQFAGLRQVRADVTPEVRERYLGDLNRAYYLIRPDQIIAGRWVDLDPDRVQSAIDDIWGKRP